MLISANYGKEIQKYIQGTINVRFFFLITIISYYLRIACYFIFGNKDPHIYKNLQNRYDTYIYEYIRKHLI